MKNTYKKLFTVLLTSIYFFSAVAPTFAAAQYLYDANGNMTSNGQNCYEYNDYNQLKKVKTCSDNKLIAEYGYNSEGQRQIKKEYDTNGNLKWTITSISDKFEVKEYPDGREEITKYYFANDQLIAKKNPDGTKEYVHNDHLGSASVITNQSGNLVEETQYDPWGEVKTGGQKSKFQYTGQEKDPETGLNYYNARYYDSHTKHFTQPDDIVQNVYDPQTLNRYSYVKNNPLKYTDPSGHFAWLALAPLIAYFLVEVAPPMLEMTPAEMETLAMMSGTGNSSANKQNQMPMILPLPMAVAGSTIAVEEAGALKLAGEKPALRGMQNSEIKAKAAYGREAHAQVQYDKGFIKELTKGNIRLDAGNQKTKQFVELKPNTPSGIKQGNRQIQRYEDYLSKTFNEVWKGTLKLYNSPTKSQLQKYKK